MSERARVRGVDVNSVHTTLVRGFHRSGADALCLLLSALDLLAFAFVYHRLRDRVPSTTRRRWVPLFRVISVVRILFTGGNLPASDRALSSCTCYG